MRVAVTVTLSLFGAGSRVSFIGEMSFAFQTRWASEKPAARIRSLPFATVTDVNWNLPAESVLVLEEYAPDDSVTSAPAIAAPSGSVTEPLRVRVCAGARELASRMIISSCNLRRKRASLAIERDA